MKLIKICPVMTAVQKDSSITEAGQAVIPCKRRTRGWTRSRRFYTVLIAPLSNIILQLLSAFLLLCPHLCYPFLPLWIHWNLLTLSFKTARNARLLVPSPSPSLNCLKSSQWRSTAQNLLAIQAVLAMTSSTSWIICYILPYQHGPLHKKVNLAHFSFLHNIIKMWVALITTAVLRPLKPRSWMQQIRDCCKTQCKTKSYFQFWFYLFFWSLLLFASLKSASWGEPRSFHHCTELVCLDLEYL